MKATPILWWSVGKGVLATMTRVITPIRTYGRERVPRHGGAVLAMNHAAWIDVVVFGTVCPRRIVYLAKVELHRTPGLGTFVRSMGTIAVRRGESDREAVRLAREAARENHLLGMFVEGTRQTSGRPGKALPGAAMVAIQEGVPVVPAAIFGSHAWRPGNFAPVSVAFGEPIRFDHLPRNSQGYREGTAEIEREIGRLWEFLADMHRLGRPRGTPPRRETLPSRAG
ncbi:MAG: 1-acyl-sn-glycerol-3-phosphate acyltransferase [Actinomycetota bacterium]|nr:1-acyl-sn-glycerol-3-phosphate acyltransferase [Actinomycetota bacterium]